MRLIDKIALNRLIQTILNFIISVLKIIAPSQKGDEPLVPDPSKRKRPLLDWLKNRKKDDNNE